MQFKETKKWVSYPFEGTKFRPVKVTGIDYGGSKPANRWIEATIQTNCESPYFLFSIIEDRHKQIDDGETIEWLTSVRQVYSVAIYPDYSSPHYSTLIALEEDIRGRTAAGFIHNVFVYYLGVQENFAKVKKCSTGTNIGTANPVEVFFPHWWSWYQDLMKQQKEDREKAHASA